MFTPGAIGKGTGQELVLVAETQLELVAVLELGHELLRAPAIPARLAVLDVGQPHLVSEAPNGRHGPIRGLNRACTKSRTWLSRRRKPDSGLKLSPTDNRSVPAALVRVVVHLRSVLASSPFKFDDSVRAQHG
jgi:hypothetical protein